MSATVTVTGLLCVVCCLAFTRAAPPTPPQNASAKTLVSNQTQREVFSNHTSMASGFVVQLLEDQVDKGCVANLTIQGNGINKTAEYACDKAPVGFHIGEKGLVIGDEWFSDQAEILVHVTGQTCVNETFGQDGIKEQQLTEDECKKVQAKMEKIKKEGPALDDFITGQKEQLDQFHQEFQQTMSLFQQQLDAFFPGWNFDPNMTLTNGFF